MELKSREDYRLWLLSKMASALENAYDPVIAHDMMRLINDNIRIPTDNNGPFPSGNGLFGFGK